MDDNMQKDIKEEITPKIEPNEPNKLSAEEEKPKTNEIFIKEKTIDEKEEEKELKEKNKLSELQCGKGDGSHLGKDNSDNLPADIGKISDKTANDANASQSKLSNPVVAAAPKVELLPGEISADDTSYSESSLELYVCELCHRSFSRKGNLKKHKVIHADQKPFECEICKKTFKRKDNLKEHMLSHSKEKDFVKCVKNLLRK